MELFNATAAEIAVKIISGGIKKCVVRWPADEEWVERQRGMKVVDRPVNGEFTTAELVGVEQSSQALFLKIRLDKDGDPFDRAEATRVITRLASIRRTADVELSAGLCVIRAEFLARIDDSYTFPAVFHLRIPTEAQMRKYRELSTDVQTGRKTTERRGVLAPGAKLFDELVDHVEGYDGPVPILHRDFAVSELVDNINDLFRESTDPED